MFTRRFLTFPRRHRAALWIFDEFVRDIRKRFIERKAEGKTNEEKLATKKQREALHKFGVKKIPENLSKREASEILDRLIGFSKESNSSSITQTVEELDQRWAKEGTQQTKNSQAWKCPVCKHINDANHYFF